MKGIGQTLEGSACADGRRHGSLLSPLVLKSASRLVACPQTVASHLHPLLWGSHVEAAALLCHHGASVHRPIITRQAGRTSALGAALRVGSAEARWGLLHLLLQVRYSTAG